MGFRARFRDRRFILRFLLLLFEAFDSAVYHILLLNWFFVYTTFLMVMCQLLSFTEFHLVICVQSFQMYLKCTQHALRMYSKMISCERKNYKFKIGHSYWRYKSKTRHTIPKRY